MLEVVSQQCSVRLRGALGLLNHFVKRLKLSDICSKVRHHDMTVFVLDDFVCKIF